MKNHEDTENPGPSQELCPGGTLLSHLETAVESRARKDVPYHGSGSSASDSRVLNGKYKTPQNQSFSFEAWQDQIDHVWKCWCLGYRGRIFRQGFTAEMQMACVWAGLSRSEVLLPLPWGERYSGGLRTATCCAWHIAPACSSYCTTPASPVMWFTTQGLPSFSLCLFFFQSFCASHYASHVVLYLDPKIFWYLLTFPPNRFPILRLLFWIWSLSRKLLR